MKMKDKTVRDVALRCRWMTVSFLILLNPATFSLFLINLLRVLALLISKNQLTVFHLHVVADGLQKKENGKRRKEDHSSRKSKDKKVCGFQSYLLLLSNFDTSKAKKDI
jgi:hypothetical protein